MKSGDKLRKIPLTQGKESKNPRQGKLENYTIKLIMKNMILAEHENGFLESFTKADVIAPMDFKLDVKKNGEWRYLRKEDFV